MISILRSLWQVYAAAGLVLLAGGVFCTRAAAQTVAEVVDVGCVWSAHPVGCSCSTGNSQQEHSHSLRLKEKHNGYF